MTRMRQVMISTFAMFILLSMTFIGNAHAELYMSVSGKVVQADTGAGLQGINLVLMSPTTGKITEAKSNMQGIFVLKDVPKGKYDILAISDDQFVMSSTTPVPVEVPSGKNVVGVAVKLQKGGAVKGKVLTSTGLPIPQANVMGSGGISATTDSRGNFLLKGALPGKVDLAIVLPAMGVKMSSVVCEAGTLVDAGNIVFAMSTEMSIRGTVVDTLGMPVSNAILVASKDNAPGGGYTLGASNGTFFITGLESVQHKLTIIAYGYETRTLSNMDVPSSGLNIVLTPSTNIFETAAFYQDDLGNKTCKGESRYSGLISLADYSTDQSAYCPGGYWLGVSVDLTAMLSLPFITASGGGSLSIGRYFCWNDKPRQDFSQTCKYVGASYASILNVGLGVSGIWVWNACQGSDMMGDNDGIAYSLGYGWGYGGFALDFGSNGVGYFSLSGGYSPPTPRIIDWRRWLATLQSLLQLSSKSVTYRHCNSTPNFFEWLCNNYHICP